MAAPALPPRSSTFLHVFGTPTLLWRVLHSVGYAEPPHYTWKQGEAKEDEEEEELDPVEDEDGEGVIDADTNEDV